MKRFVVLAVVMTSFALAACGGEDVPSGPTIPTLATVRGCHVFVSDLLLAFSYDRYGYQDGSVLVTCSIADGASEYTDIALYRSTQNGAATGGCFLAFDIENATGGWWEFKMSGTGSATATYTDVDSPNHGRVVQMSCESY